MTSPPTTQASRARGVPLAKKANAVSGPNSGYKTHRITEGQVWSPRPLPFHSLPGNLRLVPVPGPVGSQPTSVAAPVHGERSWVELFKPGSVPLGTGFWPIPGAAVPPVCDEPVPRPPPAPSLVPCANARLMVPTMSVAATATYLISIFISISLLALMVVRATVRQMG